MNTSPPKKDKNAPVKPSQAGDTYRQPTSGWHRLGGPARAAALSRAKAFTHD